MTTVLTITEKGQVTLSKALLKALGLSKGDKISVKVKDKKAEIVPIGGGILDLVSAFPEFKVPKGKTLDDMIISARSEALGQAIR